MCIRDRILLDLGVRRMRLLTNNPRKIVALEEGFGLTVVERVPLEVPTTAANRELMEAKRSELGHLLRLER